MLEELNVYLKGNTPDDYWYDSALFIYEEILMELSGNNWERLIETLPQEDVKWKIKLAECLGELGNSHEITCLLELIKTDNNDLLVACIDSLRSIDLSNLNSSEKGVLVDKANYLIKNNSSVPVKKVLEDFLAKI